MTDRKSQPDYIQRELAEYDARMLRQRWLRALAWAGIVAMAVAPVVLLVWWSEYTGGRP